MLSGGWDVRYHADGSVFWGWRWAIEKAEVLDYTKSAHRVIVKRRGSKVWLPNRRASTHYPSITHADIVLLFVFVGAGGFDDAEGGESEAEFHFVLGGEDVLLEGFGGV